MGNLLGCKAGSFTRIPHTPAASESLLPVDRRRHHSLAHRFLGSQHQAAPCAGAQAHPAGRLQLLACNLSAVFEAIDMLSYWAHWLL